MIDVVTLVGARPQFVKAAVVARALARKPNIRETLVHSGQHYDNSLSDVFFHELEIPEPAVNLGIGSGPHGQQTGRLLERFEEVLLAERPDVVLVYGDTNSTLAGALAAAKLHVPVAHVEAGLRSFNRRMPEEVNRVLTDHVSTLLFAPTAAAVSHLEREGIDPARVHEVGDVMYDLALLMAEPAAARSTVRQRLELAPGEYVLATVHRAENTDDPSRLRAVFEGLGGVARDVPVVLPLHPRTRKALETHGLLEGVQRTLTLVEPVGYLDMLALEREAAVVATDSGGVQKEAYFQGVPCVTLRDETEWTELVDLGWNRLAPPTDAPTITAAILAQRGHTGQPGTPYGTGQAAHHIADILAQRFAGAATT